MPTLTTIYYCGETKTFKEKSTERDIGPNDVLIDTTHSGLCYTDVHAKPLGCGLGHEGVGNVRDVGVAVTHLKPGDRVGWGWLHSSCGHCTTCVSGYRQYCSEARGFAFSDQDQGAFSDSRIINSAFAYRIPNAICSTAAGPLMCAGASTYEALDAARTSSNDRVGVLGIGGLGHMGILFAKAMGCAVTALTGDANKYDDALKLGAGEVRLLSEPSKVLVRSGQQDHDVPDQKPEPAAIDVLLVTSNEVPSLENILPLLSRRARIVLMTIQQQALTIPYMPFVLPGHHLIASTEASRENHIKMLEFAARHKIQPWIEEFPMTTAGVAAAFQRLESAKMRYRGVLVR
ncbi:hypothetical protein LTR86_007575 [Recurvomyces mirabilis]|nr:hypothetical protein LTR86_007575 [Recurvomyces mirabilis]